MEFFSQFGSVWEHDGPRDLPLHRACAVRPRMPAFIPSSVHMVMHIIHHTITIHRTHFYPSEASESSSRHASI